jgi:hypothetical protein
MSRKCKQGAEKCKSHLFKQAYDLARKKKWEGVHTRVTLALIKVKDNIELGRSGKTHSHHGCYVQVIVAEVERLE